MNRLRVFIATTDGPSEIQSLIEEDPDIRSVVCLNGTTESLPISKGYDAFVRKPTGVIEKLTGGRVYRMDVSRPITNGNSWQLGAYLAHWLLSQGRLAQQNEAADGIVLATGVVNARDLGIEPVGHIAEKLDTAENLIGTAKEAGQSVTVLLPAGDEQPAAVVNLHPVGSVEQALTLLGDDAKPKKIRPQKPVEPPDDEPVAPPVSRSETRQRNAKRRFPMARFLGASGLVILAGGTAAAFTVWQEGPRQWEALYSKGKLLSLHQSLQEARWPWLATAYRDFRFAGPVTDSRLTLTISGEFPADGGSCAGLRFRQTGTEAKIIEQTRRSGDVGIGSPIPCSLSFELANESDRVRHVWLQVAPDMAHSRFRGQDERLARLDTQTPPGESVAVDMKLPLYRQPRLTYQVTAVGYDRPSEEIQSLVADGGERLKERFQILESYGVSMLSVLTVVQD